MDREEALHKYMMTEVVPPFVVLLLVWLVAAAYSLTKITVDELLTFTGHSLTELPAISFAIVLPLFLNVIGERRYWKYQLGFFGIIVLCLASYAIGKYEFLLLEHNRTHMSFLELAGSSALPLVLSVTAMISAYNCKRRLLGS